MKFSQFVLAVGTGLLMSVAHSNESFVVQKFKKNIVELDRYDEIYRRVYGTENNHKRVNKVNYANLKGIDKEVFDLALSNVDNRFVLCGNSLYVEPKVFIGEMSKKMDRIELYELKDVKLGFVYYNNTPNMKSADKLNGITWKGMLIFTIKDGAAREYSIDYKNYHSVSEWKNISSNGMGSIMLGGGAIVKDKVLISDYKASDYLGSYSLNYPSYHENKLTCKKVNEVITGKFNFKKEVDNKQNIDITPRNLSDSEWRHVAEVKNIFKQRIYRAWDVPMGKSGEKVNARITLRDSGQVASVIVSSSDTNVKASIEAAIHAATPYPMPSNPDILEKVRIFDISFNVK